MQNNRGEDGFPLPLLLPLVLAQHSSWNASFPHARHFVFLLQEAISQHWILALRDWGGMAHQYIQVLLPVVRLHLWWLMTDTSHPSILQYEGHSKAFCPLTFWKAPTWGCHQTAIALLLWRAQKTLPLEKEVQHQYRGSSRCVEAHRMPTISLTGPPR